MINLYSLPKDMLIQLVATIQKDGGVEYLSDIELINLKEKIKNEEAKRKCIKEKKIINKVLDEILKDKLEEKYDILSRIQSIEVSEPSCEIKIITNDLGTITYNHLRNIWYDDVDYRISETDEDFYFKLTQIIEAAAKLMFPYITR